MAEQDIIKTVRSKARNWLEGNYDQETKNAVKNLLENNEAELVESFYKNLEFGTGGLRGIMGVGTNRMNIYTVGMATQGLSNYLKKNFTVLKQIKVAIAYDCRNNSKLYAERTADIFAANGFMVYLFEELRPTPELSFAIRHFGCQSGVVVTASHNPKEYNGYKAYWDDGAQIIAPHDKNIITEVEKISDLSEVLTNGNKKNIQIIGKDFDDIYIDRIKGLSLSPAAIERNKSLKIVYTPLHGTGVNLVPKTLRKFGFENIIHIPEQDITSGDFPTIHSPNPEEKAALEMALNKAREVDADIIMATDPDADRVGIGVKNNKNEFILLDGNQTGSILVWYLLSQWKANNKLTGKEYIVKTIVTSELFTEISDKYNVKHFDVLTGFKYIADIIKKNEGSMTFIGGGEESYGYLAGDFVRDKDAVIACALIAECAAWAKDNRKSVYDLLLNIYKDFGLYRERLVSVTKKGKSGSEEIKTMMEKFRNEPPDSIGGSEVMLIHDYQKQVSVDMISQLRHDIKLPKSDVLQFITSDGTKISVRPSGTEPKIKFYFSVKGKLADINDYDSVSLQLDSKINNIIEELHLK